MVSVRNFFLQKLLEGNKILLKRFFSEKSSKGYQKKKFNKFSKFLKTFKAIFSIKKLSNKLKGALGEIFFFSQVKCPNKFRVKFLIKLNLCIDKF